MPDDKRPKPVIDMIAEHTIQPVPRLERPEGNGGPAGIAAAAPPVPKQPQRSGRGFIGYLLAGIFGGVAATSGTYLILKLDIH
ncbi:MAG: hypothetical protein HY765_02770, partial [Rhodomicrobium sp.]|nr:hypothetical protein [Rhodomicrobium sp.]